MSTEDTLQQRLAPQYHARPIGRDDEFDLFTLLRDVAVSAGSEAPSRAGVHQVLERLGDNLVSDSLLVLSRAEGPVAAALIFLPPVSGEDDIASLLVAGHPHDLEQGLAVTLMDWMERRVREVSGSHRILQSMRMSCDPEASARVRLLEQQGFNPVRYHFTMQTVLSEPRAEIALPSGLGLVPWVNEYSESARSAFNRAFEGHWGLPHIETAMWEQRFVDVPQFRSDLSWLVLFKDEVVGMCINWGPLPQSEGFLCKRGWIEAIGVVPEWRGCGVADAMMSRSLNGFLNVGLSYAALNVDTQNLTGALQLYEKHGFVPSKREAIFAKRID